MGYNTEFEGQFKIEPTLKVEHKAYLEQIANDDWREKELLPNMPKDAPYCQWKPNLDGTALEWDGNEKFYDYIEWAKYLLGLLKSWGYTTNGEILWFGEENSDTGKLVAKDSQLSVFKGKKIVYEEVTFEEVKSNC